MLLFTVWIPVKGKVKLLCAVRRAMHTIVFLILFKLSRDSLVYCTLCYDLFKHLTVNFSSAGSFCWHHIILIFFLFAFNWMKLYSNKNNWNNKRFFSSTGLCNSSEMPDRKCENKIRGVCQLMIMVNLNCRRKKKQCGSLYRMNFDFYNWNKVIRCSTCTWKFRLFNSVVVLIHSQTIQNSTKK